ARQPAKTQQLPARREALGEFTDGGTPPEGVKNLLQWLQLLAVMQNRGAERRPGDRPGQFERGLLPASNDSPSRHASARTSNSGRRSPRPPEVKLRAAPSARLATTAPGQAARSSPSVAR